MRNTAAKYSGASGASNSSSMIGLDRKLRTWCRLRTVSVAPPARPWRRGDDAGEKVAAEGRLEPIGERAQHLAAADVEQRQNAEEGDGQHRQHQQRIDAAAGQDAIGDLEQVDRHRQHQQVHEHRERRDDEERALGERVPLLQRRARGRDRLAGGCSGQLSRDSARSVTPPQPHGLAAKKAKTLRAPVPRSPCFAQQRARAVHKTRVRLPAALRPTATLPRTCPLLCQNVRGRP